MRIKPGPFSGMLWLFFLWLVMAYWMAELLGIRRTSFMWLYMAGHGIALYIVGGKLEKRLTQTDPQSGLPLKVKLTAGRRGVLATIAILWATEYVVLLRYFPNHIAGEGVPGPFTLLCVPLLIVATILEAIWTRRIDP